MSIRVPMVCMLALRSRLSQSGRAATRYEGRLEIYHTHSWRPLCDDTFGVDEARVVCFSLGFRGLDNYTICCDVTSLRVGQAYTMSVSQLNEVIQPTQIVTNITLS